MTTRTDHTSTDHSNTDHNGIDRVGIDQHGLDQGTSTRRRDVPPRIVDRDDRPVVIRHDDGSDLGTESLRQGMVGGAILGAILGAVTFAPLGLIPWGASVDSWTRYAVLAAIGSIVGAVAGGVYWGGRLPELTGDSEGTDRSEADDDNARGPGTFHRP